MTQPNNNDDERLVEFLRQHRPDVPAASPDLEQRVMLQTVASPPLLDSGRHRRLWVVPPAIAAGLLIVWTGYRILTPASLSAAQLATLNSFLENNWDGILGSSADTQTFPLANPVNN